MSEEAPVPKRRSKLKIFGVVILLIALGVVGTLGTIFYVKAHPNPYPQAVAAADAIPRFAPAALDFVHMHDPASLPFLGSAVFDAEGDGHLELLLGGGRNQPDAVFTFKDGKFTNTTAGRGLDKPGADTTYGAASIDVNGDGQVDLFVCRDSGVYLYLNDKGKFTGKKLDLPFDKKSTAISLALGDIDRDGHVDLYAACYLPKDQMEGQNIFNKAGYGANSLLLRNNGDNTFSDVTAKAGLAYTHNTFQGVFVDLDDDGAVDLVVAHDTGEVRTYRNKGDGTFEMKPNPTTGKFSYPMGVGVGDYNNDGRIDLVFSNVGDTVPSFLARGDLRPDQTFSGKTFLFRNDGNFQFTEAGPETLTADYEFGWGLVFKDFNLDGLQDIALAQNYIGFPPHKFFRLPCRLLIQNADHTFAAVEAAAGVENRLYAISPVVADFNHDGYPDLVYANLDGPCRAFLNQGGKNHHVKVALKDVPASLGAVVTVQLADGRKLTAPFIASEGLLSDQAHVLTFGLGQETAIAEIKVKFPSGKEATLAKPAADKTHLIEPQ